MVLASLSGAGFGAVAGGYVLVVLIAWALSPRDTYGRRRALGCMFGLALFGLMFVLAFAAWAADAVF
ncbi:MAG: hypothetical protein ACJ76Z_08650 [Thermoleophilaceae bacterium]